MSNEQNTLEHELARIRKLLEEVLQQNKKEASSKPKPTLTVRVGGHPGATRQRWVEDAEPEPEYYDDSNPPDDQYRPSRISDRYLGGLNNLLGDTLEWVSDSADMAASILRPPLGSLPRAGQLTNPLTGRPVRRIRRYPR